MKPKILVGAFVLALFLMASGPVGAAVMKHNFDCKDCHDPVVSDWTVLGDSFTNLCLRCHTSGGATATYMDGRGVLSPSSHFQVGDASDALGSSPAPNKQTSHFWAATGRNPAAGADSATTALYNTYYRASEKGLASDKVVQVYCSVCHDPHGDVPTSDVATQLLRMSPVDAMCLDCHRGWDKNDAGNPDALETHPMVADYAAVVADTGAGGKNEDGKFQAFAPTGEMALTAGGVSCSTCHGVHWTDSDSSTADGPGLITAGDGKMLRGDGELVTGGTRNGPIGTAQKRSNLCQACHTYEMHGKGAVGDHQVGCLECHGGHSYNGGSPSYYVLRADNPDVPTHIDGTASANASVTFGIYAAGGSSRTKWSDDVNGTANGYCEKCHGDVQDPANIGSTANEHLEGDIAECSTCHKHSGTGWTHSFQVDASAASCGACHGFPPYLSGRGDRPPGGSGVDGGYAFNYVDTVPVADWDYSADSGYYKDEATTAHNTHAGNDNDPNYYFVGSAGIENCQPCHGPDAGSGAGGHREPGNTETFRDVIFSTVATAGGALSPVYNQGPATCDNVYCHTNGAPRTADGPTRDYTGVNTTPGWDGGKDTIFTQPNRCNFCHGNDSGTMTTKSNTVAHNKHLDAPYSYDCSVCHVDTASSSALQAGATNGRAGGKHVNSAVDVDFDATFMGGALSGESYGSVAGTCSVYCHDPSNTANTADWDVVGPLGCADCHDGRPGDATVITSGAHTIHIDPAKADIACADCHGANADAGSHTGHIDGTPDVVAGVCDTCHGVENSGPAWDVTPIWTDPASEDCRTCHTGATISSYTDKSLNAIAAPDKGTALSGGHNKASGNYSPTGNGAANKACEACHVSVTAGTSHVDGLGNGDRLQGGFACEDCHTAAGSRNAEATVRVKTHDNTDAGFVLKKRADFTKLCLACHDPHGSSNGAMIYATAAAQNAEDPDSPAKDFSGDVVFSAFSGADSFDESDGVNGDDICAGCHTATTHNNQAVSGSHNEGNDCLVCHDHDGSVGGFMPTGGTACNDCHGNPPLTSLEMPNGGNAGAHAVHTMVGSHDPSEDKTDCAVCHIGADSYALIPGGNHMNSSTDGDLVAGITNDGCTAACHSSNAGGDGSWTDTTLGGNAGDGLSCAACHYYDAAPTSAGNAGDLSLSHDDHFDAVDKKVCTDCHLVENSGNPVAGGLTHINDQSGADDGSIITGMGAALQDEVVVDFTGGVTSYTFTDAANTCGSATNNGLACHATGAPDWDVAIPATSAGCEQCHTETDSGAVNPTSGLHDNNPGGPTVTGESHDGSFDAASADCVTCHTAAPSTGHTDGTLQTTAQTITLAGAVGFNDSGTPADPTDDTCANTCHTAGITWSYKWTADVFLNDNVQECNGCHGLYSGITNSDGWTTGTVHNQGGYENTGEKHNSSGSNPYPCDDCHGTGSVGYTFSPWGTNQHGDGNLQINDHVDHNFTVGGGTAGCATASCHGKDASHELPEPAAFAVATFAGNQADVPCSGCHGGSLTGDAGNYWPDGANVYNDDATEDNSGAHATHIAKMAAAIYNETATAAADNDILRDNTTNNPGVTSDTKQKELCTYCHGTAGNPIDATHGLTSYLPADVSGMFTIWSKAADDGVYTNATDSCATTDCHSNRDTDINATPYGWYDGNAGACETCHDPDKVTQSGLAGGVTHLAHTNASGTGIGPDVACSKCHDAATDWGGNTVPNDGNHIDGTLQAVGSVSFTYSASSCGTNDCHTNGQYSAGSPVAPKTAGYTWGTAIASCDACHETTSGTLATGSHDEHFGSAVQSISTCNVCHTSETAATHYDGSVNFAGSGSNYNGASPEPINDETFSTCNTNSCHNNGKNAAPPAYTWNTNSGACNVCHDDEATSSLTSELHDEHLGAGGTFGKVPACADCHGVGAAAGTHSGHVDAVVDLVGGITYSGTPNSVDVTLATFGTCTTTICHEDGTGSAVVSPAWNDTPSAGDNCTICHDASNMTSGAHTAHISAAYGPATATDCGACHAANANNTSMGGQANHINGSVEFSDANALASTTACDNCHGNSSTTNGGLIATARSNWAGSTAVTCESCHGAGDVATENGDGSGVLAPNRGGANYTAVGHGLTTGAAPNRACSDCHQTTTAHISGALDDANRLVTQGGFNFETGGQENDYCNNCHGTTMFPHYDNTQTGGGASDDGLYCYVCHEPHGNSGFDGMVRDTIQGRAVTGFTDRAVAGSYKNASFNGVCQACHDGGEVNYYSRTENGSHNSGAACTGCHDHTADPGFSPAGGGCTSCHGDGGTITWPQVADPSNTNYPNRAGKHLEHVSAVALAYFGTDNETNRNLSCDFCHLDPGGGGHNTDNVPNKAADVTSISHILTKVADTDEVVNGQGTVYVTCSTVDCHFNNAVTPHWYDDDVAPATVSLTAVAGPDPRTIKVSWNAPGDDNNVANTTPYVYDMRYSTVSGTGGDAASDYTSTTNYVGGLPAAYAQGSNSEVIVENLNPGTTYYFSLKTRDTAGNWSTVSAETNAQPTADVEVPYFNGADKAVKGDKDATINLYWPAGEDHSMPITYDIWMTEEGLGSGAGGALDMDLDTPIFTGWADTMIELTNGKTWNAQGPITVNNDTIYNLGVRACDDQGNCETNTQVVSATPTAIPLVDKTYHTYVTSGSETLVKDGTPGAPVVGTALPVVFAPGSNLIYDVTYFVDTFAVYLDTGNNPATVRATLGYSTNGTNFTSLGVSKDVTLGKRADRVYQFKIVDVAGKTITTGQRLAIELSEVTAEGVKANYGDTANRGDVTLAERIVNAAPTAATDNVTSLTGAIVDIQWNASDDVDDGLSDTVHYDLYGSNDGGTSYDYLIVTGLDAATTSYQWDTQTAGITSGSLAVRVNAGDGYAHTSTNITGLGTADATDYVAPSAIDDLVAQARPKTGSVQLTWSAPGDDYGNHGRAAYYDIRYSTASITEGNFASASQVTGEPSPDFGGQIQNYEVTGLTPGTNYYFAIKTYDENNNGSAISTAKTAGSDQEVGGPRCGMCHTTAPSVVESVGNHKLHGFTIDDCTNCHGSVVSTYTLAHQDGSLEMGYGPGGPNAGIIAGNRIYYTDDGTPGGTVLYDDTDGFGGYGAGDYAPVGDGVDSGTCMNFGALGVGGCHGSAGTDPDGGGSLPTYPTPTWNAAATLDCAACHGNPSRTTDTFYGRDFDGTVDNGMVVPDQILGSPVVDNHGNYDMAAPLEEDRKYIGQHEKHLNYSFRFSKGDSCNLCHEGKYADKNDIDGRHANGEVDIQLDLNAAGPNAFWTPGTATTAGTCGNMSPDSCHPSAATPKWDSSQTFECRQCHGMGGSTPSHVTDPAGSGFADDGLGNCLWCHFGGHPRTDEGGTSLILANSSQVGINYRSSGIHLRKSIGGRAAAATEAELCWSCHDSNGISEWGTDTGSNNTSTEPPNASNYDYGSLTTSNWTTATWSSPEANFAYKTGAIQSTHSTNETGTSAVVGSDFSYTESPDTVDKIRCSNCHDVHNLNKAPGDTMTGQPYLRGTWIRNPYPEDGAPWDKAYTATNANYGAVPRAGGPGNNELGGYQIDQNNNSPTAGLSLATSAGLCTLCHGTDVDNMDKTADAGGLWIGTNGHSNATLGGTASNAANIFGDNIGGRPAANASAGDGTVSASDVYNMGAQVPTLVGTTEYGYAYRGQVSGPGYSPGTVNRSRAYNDFYWGVSVDASTTDIGYHAFTCSKCHNPHASRLPKLMITNCLDTSQNTWDEARGTTQTYWDSTTDNGETTATHDTAQNCHRYDPNDGVGGWNKVTPW